MSPHPVFVNKKVSSKACNAIRSVFCKKSPVTVPVPASPPLTASTTPRALSTDDFDVLLPIGHGTSSSVFLVRNKATKALHALKKAPKLEQPADIHTEQSILKSIAALPDAPRSLLSLEASWADSKNHYMLTPWCGGKDLTPFFVDRPQFTAERVRVYIAQLVVAVEALHRQRIIHRDIKPANVFLTKEGNVVLGDFGLAKRFPATVTPGVNGGDDPIVTFAADPDASSGSFVLPSEDDLASVASAEEKPAFAFNADPDASNGAFVLPTEDELCITNERCGTLHFMSPAQHAGAPYSFDADIWALGVLMFKMATNRLPFGDSAKTDPELRAAYARDPIEFRPSDAFPAPAKDLLRGLLAKDRHARPTIGQVKAHAYFAGIDWTAVARHQVPAPWVPPTPFVPTEARPKLLSPGVKFAAGAGADPEPEFSYASPGLFKRPPGPVKAFAMRVARALGSNGGKTGDSKKTATRVCQVRPTVYQVPLVAGSASSIGTNEKAVDAPLFASSSRNVSAVSGYPCRSPLARFARFLGSMFCKPAPPPRMSSKVGPASQDKRKSGIKALKLSEKSASATALPSVWVRVKEWFGRRNCAAVKNWWGRWRGAGVIAVFGYVSLAWVSAALLSFALPQPYDLSTTSSRPTSELALWHDHTLLPCAEQRIIIIIIIPGTRRLFIFLLFVRSTWPPVGREYRWAA
ncbi:kinase-like domain-containing protein [Mycena galericulata]|nr:kinase-like domain-containing protein [Mycena galericulata]